MKEEGKETSGITLCDDDDDCCANAYLNSGSFLTLFSWKGKDGLDHLCKELWVTLCKETKKSVRKENEEKVKREKCNSDRKLYCYYFLLLQWFSQDVWRKSKAILFSYRLVLEVILSFSSFVRRSFWSVAFDHSLSLLISSTAFSRLLNSHCPFFSSPHPSDSVPVPACVSHTYDREFCAAKRTFVRFPLPYPLSIFSICPPSLLLAGSGFSDSINWSSGGQTLRRSTENLTYSEYLLPCFNLYLRHTILSEGTFPFSYILLPIVFSSPAAFTLSSSYVPRGSFDSTQGLAVLCGYRTWFLILMEQNAEPLNTSIHFPLLHWESDDYLQWEWVSERQFCRINTGKIMIVCTSRAHSVTESMWKPRSHRGDDGTEWWMEPYLTSGLVQY